MYNMHYIVSYLLSQFSVVCEKVSSQMKARFRK